MVGNVAYTRNIRVREARELLRVSQSALQDANRELQLQLDEISQLQTQLKQQADSDPLTGAYNRRYFDVSINRELSQCDRKNQPLSLILVDIDHFKAINDGFGHQAGDQILIALADILRLNSRASDIVCRYGGEEFLIALPNTDLDTAVQRAEQYRCAFADGEVSWQQHRLQSTISLGIACYPDQAAEVDSLLRCADLAMYRAKRDGRNRSVAYSPELQEHSPVRPVTNR
ncbi:MAG: GGDEF domain-containing protein [Halopseudomonas sp.]|uniref:GGDEF domain-containing protein n=1 Tax=Halopseudomonas sp. TaxID=2901191 RepID=UPI003001D3E2